MEQYTIVIRDVNYNQILSQDVNCESYDNYLEIIEHAKKLSEFFSFGSSFEVNLIEDK